MAGLFDDVLEPEKKRNRGLFDDVLEPAERPAQDDPRPRFSGDRSFGQAVLDRILGTGAAGLDTLATLPEALAVAGREARRMGLPEQNPLALLGQAMFGPVGGLLSMPEGQQAIADTLRGQAADARSRQSESEKALQRGLSSAMQAGDGLWEDAAATWEYVKDNPAALGAVADWLPASIGLGGVPGRVASLAGVTGRPLVATNLGGNAALAGLQAGQGAADALVESWPFDSPEWAQALQEAGGNPAAAERALRDRAFLTGTGTGTALNVALLGLGHRLGLNVVEDAAIRAGRRVGGRARAALAGAVKEAVSEAPQGAADQLAQNLGVIAAGGQTPLGEGVGGAALLEGLAAAGPGALGGAMAPRGQTAPLAAAKAEFDAQMRADPDPAQWTARAQALAEKYRVPVEDILHTPDGAPAPAPLTPRPEEKADLDALLARNQTPVEAGQASAAGPAPPSAGADLAEQALVDLGLPQTVIAKLTPEEAAEILARANQSRQPAESQRDFAPERDSESALVQTPPQAALRPARTEQEGASLPEAAPGARVVQARPATVLEAPGTEPLTRESVQSPAVEDARVPVIRVAPVDTDPERMFAESNAWIRDNLQGREVQAPDGVPVRFSKLGRGEVLATGRRDPRRAAVVRALESLVASAPIIETAPDAKGRGGVSYAYAAAPVELNGETFAVRLIYKIGQDAGRRFYTFRGYEIADPGAMDRGRTEASALGAQGSPGSGVTVAQLREAFKGDPLFREEAATDETELSPAEEVTPDALTPDEQAAFARFQQRQDDRALEAETARLSREQGAADAERLRAAVGQVLGDFPVEFLRGYDGLPPHLRQGVERRNRMGRQGRTAGLYDPRTGKVYLFTNVVNTPERAAFTAAHEVAGHVGLRKLLGPDLDRALEVAAQNPTVQRLSDEIARQRRFAEEVNAGRKTERQVRMEAIEEALAELAAAVRTGDYGHIANRYGVDVPQGIRQKVAAAIENFLRRLKALFARKGVTFTDRQVRELLEAAWQAARGDLTAAREAPSQAATDATIGATEDAMESVEAGAKPTPRQQAMARAEQRRNTLAETLPVERGTPGWDFDNSRWVGREGAVSEARTQLQDKMLAWRDVQQQIEAVRGEVLPDAMNVYRLENLMHGRVQRGIENIERGQVEPLLRAMRQSGVSLARLEEYLYALAAKGINRRVAERNPAMPDGGSGMTDAEADAILSAVSAEERAKLDPLVQRVRGIINATRRRMLEHGLITQAQFDALTQDQTWVPLRGKPGEFSPDLRRVGGRGVDSRGRMVEARLGRRSRAQNILAEVIGDAQRSVILSEKARVGRAALRLALAHPNPTIWTVEPVQTERALNAMGEVYERILQDWSDPSIVAVRHRGQLYKLQLTPQLAKALNHVGVEQMNALFRLGGQINRYFSAVLTRYNPAFIAKNAVRDMIFGLTGLAVEHGELAALKAAVGYPEAARAMWRLSLGQEGDSKADRYAREFTEHGGRTGFVSMPSVEDIARSVNKVTIGGPMADAKRLGKALGDLIGAANDAVENALRLSAYTVLRESGHSAEQAAEYAKNMTVNFNRKGYLGSHINAFVLFYNAAMQGAHRAAKLLRHPKTWGYVGALAAAQALSAMLAMGMEDEDGEPLWNKIPEHVKRRNLVFVTPDKGAITIPMPYGFNVFVYAAGRTVSGYLNHQRGDTSISGTAGQFAVDMMDAVAEAFVPIPVADGVDGLLPQPMRILDNISENENDFGRPIRREMPGRGGALPRASMGRPDTAEVFKLLATGLNRIGGGDDYTPPPLSWFDRAPEDIEYLIAQATGGLGRFVADMALFGEKVADPGVSPSARDRPLLKDFMSNLDEVATQQALFYERKEAIERSLRRVRAVFGDGTPEHVREAEALMRQMPGLAGARFKRRKRASDNGPAGGVVTINGVPQVEAVPGTAFAAFKDAEDAIRARVDATATAYATSKGFERNAKLREADAAMAQAMRAFTKAWNDEIEGASTGRPVEYVGIGKGGRATPAPDVLRGAKNAPSLVMVGNWAGLPEHIRVALDDGAEGVYDPTERKAYVVMGLPEADAKYVAYHEIAGHYGLQGALGNDYERVLNRAMQNPTVDRLARAMAERSAAYRGIYRLNLVEEALSELAAAQRTGDYARVERDWGVEIPEAARPGLRGMLGRIVQMTKRTIADVAGEPPEAYDDEQIYALIQDAWRYVKDGSRPD